MRDGDRARPGRPRGSGADGDGERSTSSPQGSAGAAPWERFREPSPGAVAARQWSVKWSTARAEDGDFDTTGCHTAGGLTVADLIAKVGSAGTGRPGHGHFRADSEPSGTVSAGPDEPSDEQDTHIVAAPSAYASELAWDFPDLDPAREAPGQHDPLDQPDQAYDQPGAEEPTVLPNSSRRVSPRRIVRTSTAEHPAPTSRSRHRPMLMAGRAVAALIAVLSLALTGGAWQWSTTKNNRLNKVSALDPHSRDIVDPNAQYGDENFLIVGIDTRAGANSQIGAGDTEDAAGARSDTVMLVNIPASRKRVVAVSFPRDLAITPMKCEAWNADTGAYGPVYDAQIGTYGPKYVYTETKLNSAYAFGGPKCLVKVIQKLSGLSINRFMAIDFVGFSKMVDALGGVEVCTTTPLKDYELGTVLAHAGSQIVDGHTALNYVRARQVTTEDNGDYGRIKRQQLFLSSLLRSLISKDTFFSLRKLNDVVDMFISDSYVDNVKTKDLVDLGQSVQGVSAGHITFVTVPTGETDENGDEPPRKADMQALFAAIINDDPLPGESDHNMTSTRTTKSATSTAPQPNSTAQNHDEQVQALTTAPQDVTVQVSNSTRKDGLARTATDELEQHGFNVKTPDDYPSALTSTTVFYSPGNEQAAVTVASAFGNSKIERITGIGHVVQVVLGPDFRSVIAPPPSGSSVSVRIDRGASTTPTELPEDLTVTNAADTSCE